MKTKSYSVIFSGKDSHCTHQTPKNSTPHKPKKMTITTNKQGNTNVIGKQLHITCSQYSHSQENGKHLLLFAAKFNFMQRCRERTCFKISGTRFVFLWRACTVVVFSASMKILDCFGVECIFWMNMTAARPYKLLIFFRLLSVMEEYKYSLGSFQFSI